MARHGAAWRGAARRGTSATVRATERAEVGGHGALARLLCVRVCVARLLCVRACVWRGTLERLLVDA